MKCFGFYYNQWSYDKMETSAEFITFKRSKFIFLRLANYSWLLHAKGKAGWAIFFKWLIGQQPMEL